MDDLEEMITLYPTLILVSESPKTWKGIITVTNNYTNCKINVAIKIVVPSFPQMDNALVYFGRTIAFLFGAHFKSQVESLMKRSESVSFFFQELTAFIEKLIYNFYKEEEKEEREADPLKTDTTEKLLKELNNILLEESEVDLLSTKDLSAVKLTMNDISMIVQPIVNSTGQNSWKIVSSELPYVPGFTINEKKTYTLKDIRKMFQKQVDTLEGVWSELRKIDNYCCVTDPLEPKPYHMYRRIYLSPTLSFLLTLNPIDPMGYPKIKFLGAKSEVEKYIEMIQDIDVIEKWDLEYSVYENLLTLFNIDEFPVAPQIEKSEEEQGIVGDEECCICFSSELDEFLPDEICCNNKCRKRFHSTCLFQWLQEVATNKIVFNKIFGICPNCGIEVSCNVPKTNCL